MEKQDLYEMCKSIIDLNKQRYVIIKNEIEDIIRNNISDNMQIERKLDEMLDILLFYETDDSLRTVHYGDEKYLEGNANWSDVAMAMTKSPIGLSVILKEEDLRAFYKDGKEISI